jgi:hypothetical protein
MMEWSTMAVPGWQLAAEVWMDRGASVTKSPQMSKFQRWQGEDLLDVMACVEPGWLPGSTGRLPVPPIEGVHSHG